MRQNLESERNHGQVSLLYTAPTAIRSLQSFGPEWVQKYSRASLRILGSVGEPINPEAWLWYHDVRTPRLVFVNRQPQTNGALQACLLAVHITCRACAELADVCCRSKLQHRVPSPWKREAAYSVLACWQQSPQPRSRLQALQVVGNGRFPIADTWWQTGTGAHMITLLQE